MRLRQLLAPLAVVLLFSACSHPAEPEAASSASGYPPPLQQQEVTAQPAATVPLAEVPLVEVYPGEFAALTPTPYPTRSPRPTPTRRPDPTATAVPILEPPPNPAGTIFYTVLSEPPYSGAHSFYALSVDAEGQSVARSSVELPQAIGFNPFQVSPSPDGRYSVLMRPVEPGGVPYIKNEETGKIRPLYVEPYGGGTFFGWHPDHRHFLFWLLFQGLWLVDAETLEVTVLALPDGPVQGAAISPDGQAIAYIAANRPETLGALWVVSSAGSDAAPLVATGDISGIYPTAWSPDGRQIVYWGRCTSDLEGDVGGPLCLLDLSTLETRALPVSFAYDGGARWSPHGTVLAVPGYLDEPAPCDLALQREKPAECQFLGKAIYLFDTNSNEARKVVEGTAPAWSPDGSRIAFLSDRSGAPEVWMIGADGLGPQQLTSDGLFKSPFWGLQWYEAGGRSER